MVTEGAFWKLIKYISSPSKMMQMFYKKSVKRLAAVVLLNICISMGDVYLEILI